MRFLIGMIVAAAGFFPCPAASDTLCGDSIVVRADRPRYTGDFDGDGKVDTLLPVSIKAGAKLDNACVVENPWGGKPAIRNSGEPLAFAIVHGGKNAITILLDADFLSTPIWTSGPFPLSVIKKGSREHAGWKRKVRALESDVVILLTEAGIDILLHWNGKKYTLFWPKEQP